MSTVEICKGLEDVYVATTKLGYIDGEKGVLLYCGYPIEVLVEKSNYEEVCFLLLNQRLPTKKEYEEFKKKMAEERTVPPEVIEILRRLPKRTHPMDALRTSVSALSGFDPLSGSVSVEANYEMAIRILAKAPTLAAAFYRIRSGLEPIEPDPSLNHAENFYYMLHAERPNKVIAKATDANFIIYAEHEYNASAFAATVTASTLADMYGAVTSGIATLRGPLHGGANEMALEMFMEVGDPNKAEEYIKRKVERKEKIMGFGHRVYKTYDPRAKILKKMVEELVAQEKDPKKVKIYEIAKRIEEVAISLLSSKRIWPNVDYWDAVLLYLLGFPKDFFTVFFAISRIAGWSAHVLEYIAENRIIRPRALYEGPKELKYVPLEKR